MPPIQQQPVGSNQPSAEQPLAGMGVLVTRDEEPGGPMSRALAALGARTVHLPLVKHVPPADPSALREAARALFRYEWLVFTSARGVSGLMSVLPDLGMSWPGVAPKVACVGASTAAEVERWGLKVDCLARNAGSEGLLDDMRALSIPRNTPVLYPRAEDARPVLARGLRDMGLDVTEVVAYRSETASAIAELRAALTKPGIKAIIFCSPSATVSLATLEPDERRRIAQQFVVVSMGPTTSDALRALGIAPRVEATDRTFDGLARALADHAMRGAGFQQQQ
jgi:uroporphyrinogen-III synthase